MSDIAYGEFDTVAGGDTGAATFAYNSTATFVAAGAFDGSDGLPSTIANIGDFETYLQAILAKTTQISADGAILQATGASYAWLLGGSGNDMLTSEASAQGVLWGRGGDDVLQGGSGDDTIAPGPGTDNADGGGGTNVLSFFDLGVGASFSLALPGAQVTGAGTLTAGNFQDMIGSGHDDRLAGDGGGNQIDGGGGADTLSGGGGSDTLSSDGGGDHLIGGSGLDRYIITRLTGEAGGPAGHVPLAVVVSALGGGDRVELGVAANSYGFDGFTAVRRFDGTAGEVSAHYQPAHDRTVLLFDLDGDGRADSRLLVRGGDWSDYGHFTDVDTSGLTHAIHPDAGALAV